MQLGSGVKNLPVETTRLTDSQALRARLTVVSRDCPFGHYWITPGYFGTEPIMTQICAPFVSQFFSRR